MRRQRSIASLSVFAAIVVVVAGLSVPATAAAPRTSPLAAQPSATSPAGAAGPAAVMPPPPPQDPGTSPGRAAGGTESSFVTKRAAGGGQVTADLALVPSAHRRPGKQALPDIGLSALAAVPGFPLGALDAVRPVQFGDAADRLVRLGLDRGPVTLSSKDLTVGAPQQVGGRVHHAGAARDTDLDYWLTPDGVKEALVLQSAAAPTSYTFHLADPAGQLGSAQPQPGGGVTFTGRQGDLALSIPPAVAYEQQGPDVFTPPVPAPPTASPSEPAPPATAAAATPAPTASATPGAGTAPAAPVLPGADSATLRVVRGGDGFDVTVAVRPQWLAGKHFPVVLDPSLTFGNADGTVFDATSVTNGNYALVAHTDDRVGPQVENNYMWRSYLRFNTSAIPAGATVTSARFHWVRQWGGSYSPRPLELHAITGNWGLNTGSAGMNALTDPAVSASGTPDTQDFDVTALARDWVSGARGNYGISAQLNPEVMNDAYAYGFYGYYASRSTSAPNPDVTPHLFITYTDPKTAPLPVNVTALTPHNNSLTATWDTNPGTTPANSPDGYYVDVFDPAGTYLGYVDNGGNIPGNSITFAEYRDPTADGADSHVPVSNGTNLQVRVIAHNTAGYAAYGNGMTATVQGPPSAVYGPDGNPTTRPSVDTGDDTNTITATWTRGDFSGGTLKSYVAFLYPVGQHWPATPTAACSNLANPTVTFGPAPPTGNCSGGAPVSGTSYTVEVFQQNYSGDNYSGPSTDNNGTGPGYGPPATTRATDPCGMIPRDAAHMDAMAQCTSSVPLTAEEAAAQVTPEATAVADLVQWAAGNAADSYGGLETNGPATIVHIVRGAPSAAALTARLASNNPSFTTTDAAWSIARLQSKADEIATTPGSLNVVSVYPDVVSNKVVVTARTATADAVAQFRTRWATVPLDLRFDDVLSYGVNARSRENDGSPWVSGDHIDLTFTYFGQQETIDCTSGFPVYGPGAYGSGTRYGTTAGHCSEGTTPAFICQGVNCGAAYGTPGKFVDSNYSYGDEGVFANNAYPLAYINKPDDSAQKRFFVGSRDANPRDGLCADGFVTGQTCGAHLLDNGVKACYQFFPSGKHVCGLQRIASDHSLSRKGDSGGSVYTYANIGNTVGLLVVGIIVGEESFSNGFVTTISPVSTMQTTLGFTGVITRGNYGRTCC